MKRKKQQFNENFKMPHLFREDIENIEKIIKEELNSNDYKLESEFFEYQKVEEIPSDENSLNQFIIRTYSPYILINFTKNNASIYTEDDDIKTTGAVKKIIDLIHKRERKFLWYSSKIGQIFISVMLTLSILSLFLKYLFNSEWEYAIIIIILSIIWFVIILFVGEYKFSVIEFTHKRNRSNFFHRNKDKIGLIVISAMLTLFVGLIVNLILKNK